MKTKEKILNVSLKLFSSKGYSGTSMNEIAEIVGIKKPSLCFHFKSKAEIFTKLFEVVVNDHMDEVEKLLDRIKDYSTKEKLYGFFKGYLEYCKESDYIEFWNRMYYFPPGKFQNEIYKRTAEVECNMGKEIKMIIEDGLKKDVSKKILISYYYMLLGFMLPLNDYKGKTIDNDVDRCMELFWNAVKNEKV